jgi:hypothetical protein
MYSCKRYDELLCPTHGIFFSWCVSVIYKYSRTPYTHTYTEGSHVWTYGSTNRTESFADLAKRALEERESLTLARLLVPTHTETKKIMFLSIASDRIGDRRRWFYFYFYFYLTVIYRGNFIITCDNVLLNLLVQRGARWNPHRTHGPLECGG